MGRYRARRQGAIVGAVAVIAPFACTPDFNATRSPATAETVGQQLFGVVCDRMGAQSLTEDLSGASFHAVCHPGITGSYADAVDTSMLPAPQATTTATGAVVTLAEAEATRAHSVARVNALAHDRSNLIAAFEATIPDTLQIPIRNTSSADPAQSCTLTGRKAALSSQLSAMLARFGPLYSDGTVPDSTESMSRVFDAFQQSQDALAAYARFDARDGYRPLAISLGSIRPVLAYPQLRDFANATVQMLSSNVDPYAATPSPGSAYPELTALLNASYQELRTATGDGTVAPLVDTSVDPLGRGVLSRPRTNLEFMQALFYAENASFGGGASQYITKRDARGYAALALNPTGGFPPLFVMQDGLPEIDALGQFVTSTGAAAPSPFLAPDGTLASAYDSYGRALTDTSGSLYYQYLDTSHIYAASMMNDMQGLVVPNPAENKETLMNALAGAYVLAGPRASGLSSTKQYPADPTASTTWSLSHSGSPPATLDTEPVTLSYAGFNAQQAALLDLTYGLMQTLPGPENDDTLAYVTALLQSDTGEVARLIGDGLVMKANADAATTAHIPPTSTFWDEMIDVAIQIEQEPGLLEDILTSLGDDRSLGMAQAFSSYSHFNDQISYDQNNINGPAYNVTVGADVPMQTPVDRTQADTGYNRSAFQRFLQIIHDTDGLTVCNKDGATVDAMITLPVLGTVSVTMPPDNIIDGDTYSECEVFKIDNAAAFYLDSIIGKASIYLRDDTLRTGIIGGIGAATVGLMEQSSAITGSAGSWNAFWDPSSSETLRPTPQFLDRQMFFDLANDSPNGSGPNAVTNKFLNDLDGTNIGTSVCPERVITDPNPTAPDAAPDGLIHGLRTCKPQDLLFARDNDTIFVWEDFNFYNSMTPFMTAFANHNREDLFIALMEVMNRHWADGQGTADECLLSSDPTSPYPYCSKDGAVTYEPLLIKQYVTDIIPALHDLSNTLTSLTVPHCDAIGAGQSCTPTNVNGISVVAQATRQLLDPSIAAGSGLVDRQGKKTSVRNDGALNPQVTPMYLIVEALNNSDAAFASYAKENPSDTGRLAAWRTARSKLVDQFLTISGSGSSSSFANKSIPSILPVLLTTLREQTVAHCASSFSPPYPACAWTRGDLTNNMQSSMQGPLFASLMGLGDAIRQNDSGRTQLEALLTYLLNAASSNDALPAVLGSADDMIQVLSDDTNLVPFYHVAAEAARPSVVGASGDVVQKGDVEASLNLLSRLVGRVYTEPKGGVESYEDCAQEVDPNQVLNVALERLVTPMTVSGTLSGVTPLQVIMDTIADVNRAAPGSATKLAANDYMSIADNVSEFMSSNTSGLEQFYAVIRQGTE